MNSKFKLGIVGHGFVGKAVDYGFENPNVEKFYVDPKHFTTIDDLIEWDPHLTFICAPTPMGEGGAINATIAEDAVLKLARHNEGGIVLKSTVTPDIIDRLCVTLAQDDMLDRFVYNPEFLTEKSAAEQFIAPQFHIFGGTPTATAALELLYRDFSNCNPTKAVHMSAVEASFVKYAINSFLAMKVTFFNQLYDAVEDFGGNWNVICNAIGEDTRIGHSHTKVPGFDMKRGYGGACFPKDTKAFTKFSKHLTLLEDCIRINNLYRSDYALDAREKEQNIEFNE